MNGWEIIGYAIPEILVTLVFMGILGMFCCLVAKFVSPD